MPRWSPDCSLAVEFALLARLKIGGWAAPSGFSPGLCGVFRRIFSFAAAARSIALLFAANCLTEGTGP